MWKWGRKEKEVLKNLLSNHNYKNNITTLLVGEFPLRLHSCFLLALYGYLCPSYIGWLSSYSPGNGCSISSSNEPIHRFVSFAVLAGGIFIEGVMIADFFIFFSFVSLILSSQFWFRDDILMDRRLERRSQLWKWWLDTIKEERFFFSKCLAFIFPPDQIVCIFSTFLVAFLEFEFFIFAFWLTFFLEIFTMCRVLTLMAKKFLH